MKPNNFKHQQRRGQPDSWLLSFASPKESNERKGDPSSAIPAGFLALLGKSGFLINSHDPLRVHVLKHIRQNSLTRLRYSVADMGTYSQKQKSKAFV